MQESFLESISLDFESLKPYIELLIVIGIGALMGLERQFSKNKEEDKSSFAGIRTFTLVTIMAYLSTYLGQKHGLWIMISALIGTVILVSISYFVSSKRGHIGGTSEFALIVAFLLGSLVYFGEYLLAVSSAVIVTFILAFKIKLHRAVQKLTQDEIYSILIFVIISALMLPILPDQDYGLYGVFNPYKIWLIVVIFVSLNFLAYFVSKYIKEEKSIMAIGILGGFVSSTATTWYFAQQSKNHAQGGSLQSSAIVLSSSIMFPRILVWLFLINQQLFYAALFPMLVLTVIGFVAGIWIGKLEKGELAEYERSLKNPINLKEALFFGLLYVVIQLLVGWADDKLGDSGLYLASCIAGITDLDAISVSLANYSISSITIMAALIALLIAALTNTIVKYGMCVFLGSNNLKRFTAWGFIPLVLAGGGLIIYYLLA